MPLLAGRYRVGAVVGRGGSAAVHRGFDCSLRRPVAIKIMHGPDGAGVSTPLAEARTAASLSHPNVARIYDFGAAVVDGSKAPFLVMEYLPDGTLADLLKRNGPLSLAEAAAVGADVAAALASAHERGIVHRDVKPKNVMLARGGAKLVDFGVATSSHEKPVDADGRVWGTPAYSAPEQLMGERSLPAADVYALGVLLHECLTATPPWQGCSPEQVLIDRHLRPVPTLPSPQDHPPEFVDLYERCLSPRPGKRPSAAEAAQALRRVARGRPLPSRPVVHRATKPLALAAACAAVAALIAGLLVTQNVSDGPGEAGWRSPDVAATVADDASSHPDSAQA
ncbi:serine/threonine protein kinase [Actinoplanes sp. TRM 88003]|uniref:Serine/threonine protein kinase n=1 Tax=Paractinoplanes aksuensis TaxID=2939490 RepID=A0ABT1E3E2_9ACTN|nr:serine/threonine-protein kinase [Actinoplanes aksuensis]MCO8277647.1 serine/threonine protein kinase [Actinoplanes aksuensis]